MNRLSLITVVGIASALTVSAVGAGLAFGRPHDIPRPQPMPEFTEIEDVDTLKDTFFDYLTPIVRETNAEIRAKRERLNTIHDRLEAEAPLLRRDRRWLDELAIRYRVVDAESDLALIEELLVRVDTVPPSLALSQAAIESGWGRSRFAAQGHNLFGQWCYTPGCGLVPAARGPHATHEVEVFDSVEQAVFSYARNLNSHPAYEDLRASRAELRARDVPPEGTKLAPTLIRYSERGQAYVNEVLGMIHANDLEERAPLAE